MKKLLALISLLWASSAYAVNFDSGGGLGEPFANLDSSSTMTGDFGATAQEIYNDHFTYSFTGSGANTLWSGLWIDSFYTTNGAPGTEHGGGLFVRNRDNLNNQGFSFAIEGNNLCVSTYTTAACVGLIPHVKWDSGGSSRRPGALIIGVNSRVDVTSDSFGDTPLSSGTVVHFRADPASIGGLAGRRFFMLNDSDTDLQMVTAGNFIKVPVSSATVGGATLDVSKSCGGYLVLTSTGVILLGSNSFTAPSSNTTDGTFNQGCEVTIINANTTGGRTISFQNNASNFLTTTGGTIALGASGGSFRIASYPTAGVWIQTTTATK